jgi:fatty acid desaturase
MNWKVLSLAALVVLAACVVFLYLTHALFGTGPVTIAIQVCAAALMIWASNYVWHEKLSRRRQSYRRGTGEKWTL